GGGGTGIRVDLVHGSPPSQNSARQALEPTLVLYDRQPNRIPTMFRDQTAMRYDWAGIGVAATAAQVLSPF
ncbi:hypothetical protein, partial [Teichococcus vastitatis]